MKALSRNVASLEITRLNSSNFRTSNNLPIAFVVKICSTDSQLECQKTPLYTEVVGLYSLFSNRSFAVVNGQLNSAKMYAKLSNYSGGQLYAHLTSYDGGRHGGGSHQVEKFEAWKHSESQSTF